MKKQTIFWFIILLTVCSLTRLQAQVNGDYRTSNSGNFSDFTIWETYNSGWAAAVAAPTGTGAITIQAAHTVTMDVSVTMASGKAFNINGTIVFPAAQQIIGTSGNSVILNAGSFFKTANASGFYGNSSSIKNVGSAVNISATSTVEYNGAGAQTVNQYSPFGNVTINTSGGATVTGAALQTNGVLHMQNGFLHITGQLDICRPITGTATNLTIAATAGITIGFTTTAGTFIPSSITACGVLTLNNSNPVNLTGNLTMSQAYLNGGRCNNNGFYVHITSATVNDFANSYFMGPVRRTLPVGSNTYYFPIGNSTQQSVNITTTIATASTIVEATPFETTPTGTPDGTTCNGVMLNRHAVLKVIGTNNITNISQVSFQALSATPALSSSCRLAFSLDNSALSFQGRGGIITGTTVTSTRALTAAQRNDLTSGDGLFMGIASLPGTALAAGKYCIGPAASYTPPSGAAYINAASPYVSMKAALLDLNDLGVAGNSVFEIQNDYVGTVEELPVRIYYQGTATTQAEFRIREDFSGTHAIGGFVDGVGFFNAIVNMDNCSYVTINGTKNNTPGTQGLRFYNTCTSFCTSLGITINNDALNNTIKGCTIEALTSCITTSTLTGTTGSDFTNIQYCKMKQYTPVNGTTFGYFVYENGGSTCKINDIKVLDCEFENIARPILAQTAIEGNWEVSRNHIYTTFPIPGLYYPINILMNNTGNVIVENNYIGGNTIYAQGARSPIYTSAALINIRVRGTSINRISGNTIRNIKPNAAGTVNVIEVLANSSCQINDNLLGDSTIANAVDFTTAEPTDLKFIRYTNDGTSTINSQVNNNMMANIRFQHTTHTGIHQFISINDNVSGTGTYTLNNNILKQIGDAGATGYQCFYLTNSISTRTLTANGNVIESLSRPQNAGTGHNFYGFYSSGFNGTFNGNRIGKWNTSNDLVIGTPNQNSCYHSPFQAQLVHYTNDTIANVNFTNGSTANSTTGIYAGGGGTGNKLVNGNVIQNLSSATTKVMTEATTIASSYPLAGIILYGAGSNNQVNNNKIDGLNATSTAATNVGVLGMDISGGSAILNNNTIYNLTNTATGTVTQPLIAGIRLMPNSTLPLTNNMIGISNGAHTNAVRMYGILAIGSGTFNAYFNTITIGGNSIGIARSAAYWKTTLGNYDLRNNIFHNNRTGGTLNYAIVNENGTGTGGGWTYLSNYNNIYSANAATTGAWPLATPKTFAQWQAVSGDANSKNTDVRFVNASTDLHMATATNCNLDKEGTNIAGITLDIDSDTRHATTPSIGADEFTYNPNWATASSNSIVCSPPQSLNLTVTDNTYGSHSYQWSGPNGYTSTAAAPVVTSPTAALHTGNYTATVTDVLGCASTPTTAAVTIYEPPMLTCPGNVSQVNDAGACGAVVTYPAATATGVPNPVIYYSHPSGSFFPVGTTTVTVSAVNYCDSVTCSFDITVTDTELPVITNCPANISLNNDAGLCTAIATWTAPTVTDNCAIQTFTSSHNSGASFPVGTTTVTFTATDVHGNVQTCSFNVVVTDNELPVISNCPANISVNNDAGLCSAIVNWTAPTATDNCAIQTFSSTHNSGAAFPVGTTNVVYTATDVNGNVQTCSFTITVTDNELPVISNCPANISVNTDVGLCSSIVTWTAPTASDNCSIQTFTSSHNSGAAFPVGTTNVFYTATDVNGNVQTCSFTITVTDNELPVISNCPANISVNTDAGLCSSIVTWTAPTASDNCSIQTFTSSHSSGASFPVGTTTVVYTATDVHGNVETCSFNVVVTDSELPVISNCPANININNSPSSCNTVATWTAPTASDNCGIQTFTSSHNSGSVFTVGTTTVTYTATDVHGNVQTCSFNVVVTDNVLPVISNCPANINLNNSAGLCSGIATWTAPTATDNCGIQTFTSSHNSGASFPVGTTTVTYTATDIYGNVQTCSFNVTVNDTEVPSITCAPGGVTCSTSPTIGAPSVNDNCGIDTVYNNAPNVFPYGATTIVWTVVDIHGNTNTCNQIITVGTTPTVNAGNDLEICAPNPVFLNANVNGAYSSVLWSTGGDGTFSNTTVLNPVYTPGNNDKATGNVILTLTATGSPIACAGSDQINVKVRTTLPLQPSVVNGALLSVCPPLNGVTLSVTNDPNVTSYSWANAPGSNGITFNPPSTTNTQVIDIGTTTNSTYNIRVTASNACGSSLFRGVSIRRSVGTPASITGSTITCAGQSYTYSILPVTGAETYTWVAPAGASINGGGNTITSNLTMVNIQMPSVFSSGNISVTANVACFSSAPRILSIGTTTQALSLISGSAVACPGSTQNYIVPTVLGAVSYQWILPANTTGSSSTNTINVTFNTGFTSSNICVKATSVCGVQTAQRCKSVTTGLPLTPTVLNGISNGICGQTVNYSCPPVSGATGYVWTLPAGASGSSNSNSILVTFPSSGLTTATLSVQAQNNCGLSLPRTITVKGAPNTPGVITATPATWCNNDAGISFSADLTGVTGLYNLAWSIIPSSAANIILGQGTNNLFVDWNTGNATINLTATNGCGNGTRSFNAVTNCRQAGDVFIETNQAVMIYPNPANDLIYVELNANSMQPANFTLYDVSGKVVYNKLFNVSTGLHKEVIDVKKIAKGIYTLKVYVNETLYREKMVIN